MYVKSNSVPYKSRCFSRRLLVGAPQAKLLGQVNVTGAVYQCDLSTTTHRCQPIEFDDEGLFVHFCWNWFLYIFNSVLLATKEGLCRQFTFVFPLISCFSPALYPVTFQFNADWFFFFNLMKCPSLAHILTNHPWHVVVCCCKLLFFCSGGTIKAELPAKQNWLSESGSDALIGLARYIALCFISVFRVDVVIANKEAV